MTCSSESPRFRLQIVAASSRILPFRDILSSSKMRGQFHSTAWPSDSRRIPRPNGRRTCFHSWSGYSNHYMSFIRKIKKGGKIYLAEVESRRVKGKVVQRFIRY